MRLYHRWKCPWCAAARQAIENVGAPVELVEVQYPRDERDELEAISGQRRVPVLVDGDQAFLARERETYADLLRGERARPRSRRFGARRRSG